MFADAEISPVTIDYLCPKTVGWIWRALALKHFCRYNSYYFVLLATISIHIIQTLKDRAKRIQTIVVHILMMLQPDF